MDVKGKILRQNLSKTDLFFILRLRRTLIAALAVFSGIAETSLNTRYGTGSEVNTVIRNLLCGTNGRFRINELTSTVPCAVRSILRNDRMQSNK